ncbi:uncharacterized protein C21orf62 homolog isoform X2 [Choloepus didactylus]|uniref:uncharacterized protein C21orf62 homolog isoform X2 n=1 Tax=Choloepus didactylus TaxID=27675 RepID=UPI00189DF457|nr:uncharacterized protein C21orf62 homolog isoform X2 [Choloepus didactylus]
MEMARAAVPPQTEKNSKGKTEHSSPPCRLNRLSSPCEGSVVGQRSVEPRGESCVGTPRCESHRGDTNMPSHAEKGMALPSRHCLLLISTLGIFALDSFTQGQNSTLIFTKENTIRNCSCSADILDCDYSLANLLCSCKTILPSALERTSYSSHLTIWFTDVSALGLLLNFTLVQDLKLSLCSTNTLPTEYLAIWGLKRLRISTEAKLLFPEQSLLIHDSGETESNEKPLSLQEDWQTSPDYRFRRAKNTLVLFTVVFLQSSTMLRT